VLRCLICDKTRSRGCQAALMRVRDLFFTIIRVPCTGTNTVSLVENLGAAHKYVFRLTATNSCGPGPPSPLVLHATPAKPRRVPPPSLPVDRGRGRVGGSGIPAHAHHTQAQGVATGGSMRGGGVGGRGGVASGGVARGGMRARAAGAACKFGAACRSSACSLLHPTPSPGASGGGGGATGAGLGGSTAPCKFGTTCRNTTCPFVHSSPPAASPAVAVAHVGTGCSQMPARSKACKFGAACRDMNLGCLFVHPLTVPSVPTAHASTRDSGLAPATAVQTTPHLSSAPAASEAVEINLAENVRTPTAAASNLTSSKPCKFGANCLALGCKFSHPPVATNRGKPAGVGGRGAGGGGRGGEGDDKTPMAGHVPTQTVVAAAKVCKFGAACKNRGCTFLHPSVPVAPMPLSPPSLAPPQAAAAGSMPANSKPIKLCKFGANCRTTACKFSHASGAREAPRESVPCPTLSIPTLLSTRPHTHLDIQMQQQQMHAMPYQQMTMPQQRQQQHHQIAGMMGPDRGRQIMSMGTHEQELRMASPTCTPREQTIGMHLCLREQPYGMQFGMREETQRETMREETNGRHSGLSHGTGMSQGTAPHLPTLRVPARMATLEDIERGFMCSADRCVGRVKRYTRYYSAEHTRISVTRISDTLHVCV